MSGWGWSRYVPVAERRLKAKREMARLQKKGKNICPVEIEGRTIARTFWGKGWCNHLESYSDYDNRLPRGRTYARNGSVCHLEISMGEISAKAARFCTEEPRSKSENIWWSSFRGKTARLFSSCPSRPAEQDSTSPQPVTWSTLDIDQVSF